MHTTSRWIDSLIALGVGLTLLAAVLLLGDPIYAGVWYYLITWLGLVGLVQIFKAPPLFTAGAGVALAMSFLFYWAWQASLSRPEGLLGLGHLFSLPGLGIAAVVAAIFSRRRQLHAGAAFVVGLLACCFGFAAGQLVVCRSVVNCGSLSGLVG